MSDVRSFLHTQIKKSLLHTSARHGNEESEGRGEGCVVSRRGRRRSSRTAKAKLVLASLQGILPTLVNILLQTVVVGKFPPLQIFNTILCDASCKNVCTSENKVH